MKDLTILIPTLEDRKDQFLKLKEYLLSQVGQNLVAILSLSDNGTATIGQKRNTLLNMAATEYVAFFDDDDWPSHNYISLLMEGINKGVDCCSLKGEITWKGKNPEVFEHSIRYKEYRTNDNVVNPSVKYERYPNHLNCIKADIAKQFRFPETSFCEDTVWATQIFKSGLIKTEHYIPEIIYFYRYTK